VFSFELRDLGWIAGVLVIGGGSLIAWIRYRLGEDFARATDVAAANHRLTVLEQRVATMPSYDDMQRLLQRMAGVEQNVAVVGEKVAGVAQIMTRIEHQQQLISEQLLRGSR
jgi:hypothetical protein